MYVGIVIALVFWSNDDSKEDQQLFWYAHLRVYMY